MSGYIDTRELIEEVQGLGFADPDAIDVQPSGDDENAETWHALEQSERDRIIAILNLRDSVGSEFDYGATLIPESEFVDYARELAFPPSSETAQALDTWPYRCIDWEQVADELRVDYTSITFDGTDYLVRCD